VCSETDNECSSTSPCMCVSCVCHTTSASLICHSCVCTATTAVLDFVHTIVHTIVASRDVHRCAQHVAFMVKEGVTAEQCKHRFWQLQHILRQAGTFTVQESQDCVAAVREHGQDWSKVRSSYHALFCLTLRQQHSSAEGVESYVLGAKNPESDTVSCAA
jgi:hypothetical protein